VRDNVDADAGLNLIARVQTHPVALFEVYEPAPGVILYSGAGGQQADSTAGSSEAHKDAASYKSMSLLEIWALVTSGEPPPPEVQAAAERQRVRWEAAGVSPTPDAAIESGATPDSLSEAGSLGASDGGGMALSGGFCDNEYFTDNWSGYPLGIPGSCPGGFNQTFCLNDVVDGTHWAYN